MRVLMLSQNIVGVGGTYARCYTLARGLAALGHQVTVLAACRRRQLAARAQESASVRVVEMGSLLPTRFRHGGLSPFDLVSRLVFVAGRDFDLVHTFDHRPTVSIPALYYRRLHRAPVVGDWCDLWGPAGLGAHRNGLERLVLTPLDDYLEGWVHQRVNAITAISTELMTRARALGHADERIRLVLPGANDDLIRPMPAAEARARLSLPLDAPVLVYSGYTAFGGKLLGEAFVNIVRRLPSTLLLMAGGHQNEFESIVARANVATNVTRFGALPAHDLATVLAGGDVMLLPLPNTIWNRAGYPNKVADYMAAGRPIVANPTGDLGQLMREEEIGLAVSEDPQAFAEAVCALLADPARREAMGRRARQLAETRFSGRAMAAQADDLYRTLSHDRSRVLK